MNKINNFFNSIFNFFDRHFIMPITRFIYKFTKKVNQPNKRFETWLSRPTTLLFVSLFMALAIFIVVDRKIINFSSQTAEVFKNQTVNVKYNEEQYVVEGIPESVDVTLIGSKADLYIAKQSANNGVTVDLTGLSPGTHKVAIEYDHGLSNIEYSVNPSVVKVTIYKKISDTRELTYDILNSDALDNKLVVNSVDLSMDEITIRGAQYKIDKVATVKALIDLNKLSTKDVGKQELKDVDLKAYDAEGNVVDVEFVPSKISATVDLASPNKTVPLNFKPINTLPTGKAISSYTFSEKEVAIYGDSDILDSIESIDVEIDVSKLTSDTELKAQIKKPTGVKSISKDSVSVSISVTDASSTPVKFTVPLTGINVAEGLIANPVGKDNGSIVVEVQGASSVLDTITKDDITVYVDLKDKTVGTYTEKIYVKGTNPLVTYNVKRTSATVEIVKKG